MRGGDEMAAFDPPAELVPAKVKARLLGHQGRCFDVRYSQVDESVLLSSSEDGTARLWDLDKKKCLQTLVHNPASEALRCAFMGHHAVVAGSDGAISVWNCADAMSSTQPAARAAAPIHRYKHSTEFSQVYVCEPSPHCASELLSGADSSIYLWDLGQEAARYSFAIEPLDSTQQPFGGARNASGEVFVFDAKWCPQVAHVLAVAASDATVRMLDFRTPSSSGSSTALIMDLSKGEGAKGLGHATSVSTPLGPTPVSAADPNLQVNWGSDTCAHLLSVTFGSGCVGLFDVRKGADCLLLAQLHSGTCYGAPFLPPQGLLSYSRDASVK